MAFRQKSESRNRGSRRPLQGWTKHIELQIQQKDVIPGKKNHRRTFAVSLWSGTDVSFSSCNPHQCKASRACTSMPIFTQIKRVRMVFTSAVLPTQIGKSPHVAQSNCVTHTRQEKIKFSRPRLPVGQILLLLLGLHVQGFWLVIARGHLVQFSHLSVRLGAVGRHVSGFCRGPGSRTGGFSTSPRRQQLRGLISL